MHVSINTHPTSRDGGNGEGIDLKVYLLNPRLTNDSHAELGRKFFKLVIAFQ